MKQFCLGLVLGSLLTGSIGMAASLYDRNGQPAAPSGSIQQFDYFRQRQQQLDIGAMRQQAERNRLEHRVNPCAK